MSPVCPKSRSAPLPRPFPASNARSTLACTSTRLSQLHYHDAPLPANGVSLIRLTLEITPGYRVTGGAWSELAWFRNVSGLLRRSLAPWVTMVTSFTQPCKGLEMPSLAPITMRASIPTDEWPKPLRLTGTALFSDIVGFTTISENLDPECLTSWLNAYMSAMSGIVLAHGGSVLQFVGDGILAAFGVPVPRNSDVEIDYDAAQAVHCALTMREELLNLNRCWERKGLPTVAIRVGLHTGTIVASRIGTRAHWEYTVVGDTVNTAARLQALPRLLTSIQADGSCCILISGATWERLNGAFNGHLLGNVALKGKVQLVPVYQIGAQSPSLRKRTVA